MAICRSVVKWFDAQKGFGFIEHPEAGPDIFVHYSQVMLDRNFKVLRTRQSVEFELMDGPKGLHARNVRIIDEEAPVRDRAPSGSRKLFRSLAFSPSC